KEQKTTYLDIGSNIDCGIETENDSRFHVYLTFERSALYPNKSGEGEKLVTNPGGNPLVRTFRGSENLILKDGQTSENLVSTDPLNGHTVHVSVTINVQKQGGILLTFSKHCRERRGQIRVQKPIA